RATDGLGQTLRILDTGVSIKRYPVCYGGHRLIDGALDIAKRENLQADDVREIRVTVGAAQAAMMRNRQPRTVLEAKFSAEFDVASALVAREVGLAQLTETFVARSDVQALMKKVHVAITERACPIDPAFSFADTVTIEMRDGSVYESGEIRFAKGNAKNPVSVEDLRTKFMDCLEFGGQSAAHPRLYERLSRLRDLNDLRQLFE
ncbi:MAG: MmgE/PrpD family protein, partial [Alcaligenaceae bacterium]